MCETFPLRSDRQMSVSSRWTGTNSNKMLVSSASRNFSPAPRFPWLTWRRSILNCCRSVKKLLNNCNWVEVCGAIDTIVQGKNTKNNSWGRLQKKGFNQIAKHEFLAQEKRPAEFLWAGQFSWVSPTLLPNHILCLTSRVLLFEQRYKSEDCSFYRPQFLRDTKRIKSCNYFSQKTVKENCLLAKNDWWVFVLFHGCFAWYSSECTYTSKQLFLSMITDKRVHL